MKKTLLILITVLVCSPSYSQFETYQATKVKKAYQLFEEGRIIVNHTSDDRDAGDLIVGDDFSDPANWNLIALDGDPNWEIVIDEPEEISDYMGDMESTTEANGFGLFNGIQYLIEGTVTTQDAVLEYAHTIDCSEIDHVTLSFEQRYRSFHSEKVFIEVSINDGVSYDFSYEVNNELPVNVPVVQEVYYLNIADAAAGQEFVKIRFRWIEETGDLGFGSGYGWIVDDFKVLESWDYDQKITAAYHRSGLGGFFPDGLDYYQIEQSQTTEIYFSAKAINLGGAVQENLHLNVEVSGAGTFSGASDSIDLAISGSDSLGCSLSFTPDALGEYFIKYWFSSDSSEQFASNDTIYDSFVVSTIYGRDNQLGPGFINNVESNSGAPLLIGNVMELFEESNMSLMEIEVTDNPSNIGQMIFGQIMVYNPETDHFDYYDQTDDHYISSGSNGEANSICFNDEVNFPAGSIVLLLAGHYGGENEVEFKMAQIVDYGTVLGYTSGASDPFALENPRAIMVRTNMMGVFDCFESINEDRESPFSVSQNVPNPFFGSTTIAYELSKNEDVQITITDLSGKTIQTINLNNQPAGKHELSLNATDFAEGVYFYTFNVGDE
ncbi:MAG: hypothetical protein ACI8ZM_001133 [Crocinitomix sp.]|jgi:hypothetical protein